MFNTTIMQLATAIREQIGTGPDYKPLHDTGLQAALSDALLDAGEPFISKQCKDGLVQVVFSIIEPYFIEPRQALAQHLDVSEHKIIGLLPRDVAIYGNFRYCVNDAKGEDYGVYEQWIADTFYWQALSQNLHNYDTSVLRLGMADDIRLDDPTIRYLADSGHLMGCMDNRDRFIQHIFPKEGRGRWLACDRLEHKQDVNGTTYYIYRRT